MKDYYRILEIHPEASQEVMNKAYRALVQKYHPDRFHTSRKAYATLRMQEINEAYETLSSPASREVYDARYRAHDFFADRPVPPESWSSRLQRLAFWFVVTFVVLLALRGAGRFLLTTTPGKLLLLGVVVYLAYRFQQWRRSS